MSRGRGGPAVLFCLAWLVCQKEAALTSTSQALADVRGIRIVIVALRGGDSVPIPRPASLSQWADTEPEAANLTDFGADQAFELGIALKDRYGTLLREIAVKDVVGAVSASAGRHERTMESFLEGLHFEEEDQRRTKPKTQQLLVNDTILNPAHFQLCPEVEEAWEAIHNESLPFLKQWSQDEAELLEYISKAAKVPGTLKTAERIAAGLLQSLRRDERLPGWFRSHPRLSEKELIQRILRFTDARALACAHSAPCRNLMAGTWAKEIWSAVDASLSRSSSRAMIVFGPSDATMHALMESMGFVANNYLPPAAGFILEIRPTTGKNKAFQARVLFHRPRKITADNTAFHTDFGIAQLRKPCLGEKDHWCPGQEFEKLVLGAFDPSQSIGCGIVEVGVTKIPFDEALLAVGGDGERKSPCEDHLKEFLACGSLCPPACGLSDHRPCIKHCVAACYCIPPFVLSDPYDLASPCVLRRRCSLLGKDSDVRLLPHEDPHPSLIKASESLLLQSPHLSFTLSQPKPRFAPKISRHSEETEEESRIDGAQFKKLEESRKACDDPDKEFDKCGNGCPPGCGRLSSVCELPCRSGCYCPSPLVLADPLDGSSACIHPKLCPTTDFRNTFASVGIFPQPPVNVPDDPPPDAGLFLTQDSSSKESQLSFSIPPPLMLREENSFTSIRVPRRRARPTITSTIATLTSSTQSTLSSPLATLAPSSTSFPALLSDDMRGNCSDADKEWLACGPPCPSSCGVEERKQNCIGTCVSGCFCRRPFVRAIADDVESACILPARCPDLIPPNFVKRGDCEDSHENCEDWMRRGECRRNPYWMRVNCPSSCDCCGCTTKDVAKRELEDCVDYNEECPFWTLLAECRNNPSFMRLACRHSCRLCQPQVTPPKS